MKPYKLADGFSAMDIPDEVKTKMLGVTIHTNDKITFSDLAYLKLLHYDFNGTILNGELVCNHKLAKEVLRIFKDLYDNKYPIEKIRLADDYGGDDDKIMSDNNSSCFNYRVIADTNVISMHGQGRAIDINPFYNPYIVGDKIMPSEAYPYADRSKDFPYKIDENDLCFKVFRSYGWLWGGNWVNSKDYQHFYKPEGKIKRTVIKLKKLVDI